MEEINLKELFDYFKSKILIISIIMLAIILVGCVRSLFYKTPMYSSTTSIVLVSDDGTVTGNGTYSQTDANLNQSLVNTYSEIVKCNRVIEGVIKNLSLPYSSSALKRNITVSNKTNTEVIEITVIDEDPETAAEIANEIVLVFSREVKDIYKLQNVSQVDIAEVPRAPYNINVVKDLIIYCLVGFVVAFGTIFVVYYFDTTIKSPSEVEEKLGLPVFGVVPKVRRKDSK